MPVVQRIEHLVAVQAVGGSIPLGHTRRSARVVYLAGFENRAGRKTHTGSNPVSSAEVNIFFYVGFVRKAIRPSTLSLNPPVLVIALVSSLPFSIISTAFNKSFLE